MAQIEHPDGESRTAAKQLEHMLDLQPLEEAGAAGTRRFLAPVFPQAFWRVFGGQVLAQATAAAMATVEEDRAVHSVHGYFLRPGDATEPIEVVVDELRDGGSFSARRSQAYQDGRPILSMIASFQKPAAGLAHQQPMPLNIPQPEDLAPPEELIGHVKHPVAQEWGHGRPFEIRHVDRPIYLAADRDARPSNAVWMKTRDALPDDPDVHRAAILFASDYTLLEPVLRAHGLYWAKPGMKIASLDHAFWWHRDARADQWLLYLQDSPSAQGARGLGTGSIYTREGELVATAAQEGMVRAPQGMRPKIRETLQRRVVSGGRTQRQLNRKYNSAWRSRYLD